MFMFLEEESMFHVMCSKNYNHVYHLISRIQSSYNFVLKIKTINVSSIDMKHFFLEFIFMIISP
jgi:hypothetical protein